FPGASRIIQPRKKSRADLEARHGSAAAFPSVGDWRVLSAHNRAPGRGAPRLSRGASERWGTGAFCRHTIESAVERRAGSPGARTSVGGVGAIAGPAAKSEGAMADPLSEFRLDGEVAVVTGGTSGLGRVVADAFAAVGARVVNFDLAAQGDDAYAVDVADEGQ